MSRKHEAWRAEQEIRFIGHLRARLEILTDDNEVVRDTIEGEVDLDGIMNALLGSYHETGAVIDGRKAYLQRLQESVKAQEAYREHIKGLLLEGLTAAGQDAWKGLLGSVTIGQGGLSVDVLNEALVPANFWKPVLDKAALRPVLLDIAARRLALEEQLAIADQNRDDTAKALIEAELAAIKDIPGAQLKRGDLSVTIREPSRGRKKAPTETGDEV